jgi:hypothetical protein
LSWWLNLFNPPPLAAMTRGQKIGRIMFVSVSLIVSCVLLSMIGAMTIFLVERGTRMLRDIPELMSGLEILLVSAVVNTFCVSVIIHLRNVDRKLMASSPLETSKQG